MNSLGGQRLDVSDLSADGHGETVDDIEVLLSEQEQPLASVQTLHPRTPVHVLDLVTQRNGYIRGYKHLG